MVTTADARLTPLELAERRAAGTREEDEPYGHVTPSAHAFWTLDGSLEVIDTDEGDDTVRVAARGALLPGLPVRSSDRGEAVPSTCAL
jgi:hypothetical protein